VVLDAGCAIDDGCYVRGVYQWEPAAGWWFVTDIAPLPRHMVVDDGVVVCSPSPRRHFHQHVVRWGCWRLVQPVGVKVRCVGHPENVLNGGSSGRVWPQIIDEGNGESLAYSRPTRSNRLDQCAHAKEIFAHFNEAESQVSGAEGKRRECHLE
jgi:hypothetical protein